MFYLVRNTLTGEYKTIYKKDKQEFLNLHKFFQADKKLEGKSVPFNWEVIEDINEIKKILDTQFTSKGRGEDYNEDLPSSTKIAYSLFPINLQTDKFLLRWFNNTPVEEQGVGASDILSKGTFVHYILEQFVCDREARKLDKPLIESIKIVKDIKKPSRKIVESIDKKIVSDIRRYIQKAYTDPEILRKIPNLDDLKEELEFLATSRLLTFIKNELIFTDLVYSEIFINTDDIQGSVDLVAYKDGKFSIIDYKTTSSIDKTSGRPKFKTNNDTSLAPYARQLYIYNKLLKESNFSHCIEDEHPDFYIVQLHLINGQYKKFPISWELVQSQGKTVDKVLEWYWNARKGIEMECEPEFVDDFGFIDI